MICNSTGSSNVQRKSCCAHPQRNIYYRFMSIIPGKNLSHDIWVLQRYENSAPGHKRQHNCRSNFPLTSSCKMKFVFERVSVKHKTQKCIFCINFRSSVHLLKTKLLPSFLFFHTIFYPFQSNTRPTHSSKQVVQDWSTHCYQFCTVSLVRGCQSLWKGSWQSLLTNNQMCFRQYWTWSWQHNSQNYKDD